MRARVEPSTICTACLVSSPHRAPVAQHHWPAVCAVSTTLNATEPAEQVFYQITRINSFFLEKERALLNALATHSAVCESDSLDPELTAQANQFFLEVSSLYAFGVLNYLALLKIMKKHDKISK